MKKQLTDEERRRFESEENEEFAARIRRYVRQTLRSFTVYGERNPTVMIDREKNVAHVIITSTLSLDIVRKLPKENK